MKREFTHGGSHGKNALLLLRSLLNIAAFSAVWCGAGNGNLLLLISGGCASLALIWWNLIQPLYRS